MERMMIGKSTVIKGELTGEEDLTIEGTVEGRIELRNNTLTVGQHATIKAETSAKAILVIGTVTGNLTASDRIEIRETGRVEGDITAPKVAMADGAHFRGKIDMSAAKAAKTAPAAGQVHATELGSRPQSAPVAQAGGRTNVA